MARTRDLTQGNIQKTILRMTVPMILGMLGMVAFNFADTAFVGQLGEAQLAALAFTFPVVMIVQSVAQGLSIGAGSVIARAAANRSEVRRLTTDGLILSFIVVVLTVAVGIQTIEPVFTGAGAGKAEMVYVRQYMTVWFIGVPMVVIPMVGNGIIRALGDTKVPGIVMMIAAGINIVLDPLLIFGIWIFPRMGVVGAAVATVAARFVTLLVALYVLGVREKLLTMKGSSFAKLLSSFGRILHIGVPSMLTRAIVPLGTYIITGMLAAYGMHVVAGYGAGVKTEFVALSALNALAVVIISFVGQNYGAGRLDRVKKGFRFACAATAVYGLGMYAVLFFAVPYIAPLFNSSTLIQQMTVLYVRIAVAGLVFQGGVLIITSAFNAAGKPFHAAFVSLVQMFGLYIPLALLFSQVWGQAGIFVALVLSYVLSSAIGYGLFTRFVNKMQMERAMAREQLTQDGGIS